jgi:AraC family transcriptional regulator of adaptative response / DNA-3-methyladenine glycosylase II
MESDTAVEGIQEVAGQLGVSSRHLRRLFQREYGVAPVRFLRTRRLLTAKTLLTDTMLPITEVAFASGFGSVRRFNETFLTHYGMPPSRFRQGVDAGPSPRAATPDQVTLLTGYRGPLDWEALLAFLGPRTIAGIDSVTDGTYRRAVRLIRDGEVHSGYIEVLPAARKQALAVTIPTSLLPVLPTVLSKVRTLFDLDCEPRAIYDHLRVMDSIIPGSNMLGVRMPGAFDAFEMAVRAILGQQVTMKAARTLINRLAEALGQPIENPIDGLVRAFPSAEAVSCLPVPIEEAMGPLGITGCRARAIHALAQAMTNGMIDLSPTADVSVTLDRLLALPGIGPWTAHYLAMRVLAWPDAFPHTDHGVRLAFRRALGPDAALSARRILELAEPWKPWRAYATMNLWRTL